MNFRIFSCIATALVLVSMSKADQVPFAIVHGPKAAFNITAPDGWIIDNGVAADQGMPCVLYRKGESWDTGDPVMYTKIASTSVEDAEAFAKAAIEDAKKRRGEYKIQRVETGKTKDGQAWFVNEYSPNEKYHRFERVAYVQLPKAVAYIVYTSDDEKTFHKHQSALQQLLKSFSYLELKKD